MVALREKRVQVYIRRDVRRLPVRSEQGLDVEDVQHGGDGDEQRVVRKVPSRTDPGQDPSVCATARYRGYGAPTAEAELILFRVPGVGAALPVLHEPFGYERVGVRIYIRVARHGPRDAQLSTRYRQSVDMTAAYHAFGTRMVPAGIR